MNKLFWNPVNIIKIDGSEVPISCMLKNQNNQVAGVRHDSQKKLFFKKLSWPTFKFLTDFFIDGFIEKGIGKWIRNSIKDDSTFLDIGCGNTRLHKYLPKHIIYNAFDLSISEFHLRRILLKKNSNVCLCSATHIPLESNTVSLAASTECFRHIPEFEKAILEIYRILKPGAVLICSNANPYSYKYKIKGPNENACNNWSNEEFIELMKRNNFRFVDGYTKGYWVPLPSWITKASIQLPISSKSEYYNTNFFYKFEVVK
ncbi:MAG: class I SAM-dependent methyltransferase [Maribacter arcticus]|uniref:class I SAM-dependent methyltransferase n=1 Tax=Maribacter arcticus TaxID=561365 RepID=UPI00300242BB|tara:strand:- start:898 stop:1674 length:777 start_codon:yes stop_codon:yes gene_type:complete